MPFWNLVIFVAGACLGSFFNVCIYRIPRDISIVTPASKCPSCGKNIPWHDNIPILSWLLLGAKCRGCAQKIASSYFWVELVSALMFLAVWLRIQQLGQPLSIAVPYFLVTSMVILTVCIDSEHMIIPDEVTVTVLVLGLLSSFALPENWGLHSRWSALGKSAACAFAVGTIFSGLALLGEAVFKKEALGWGDVKFMAALAACLGIPACFFTMLAGSLLGSIYGLYLVFWRKKPSKTAFPFGPFLAASAYIWVLFGNDVTLAYLRLAGWMEKKLEIAVFWM